MTDRGEIKPDEVLLAAVRDETNAREEKFKQDYYEHLLFHDTIKLYSRLDDVDVDMDQLRVDFLRDKKDRDMFGRFELALDDKYLGIIHVVELGYTTKPAENGDIDGLKEEYVKLKNWMIEMGLIDDELSREESGRVFDVTASESTNKRIVIGRTRPLISRGVQISKPGGITKTVQIDIAKRMVFSVPTELYLAFAKKDPELAQDSSKKSLEEMLQNRHRAIDSIRTTYYLRTAVLADHEEDMPVIGINGE